MANGLWEFADHEILVPSDATQAAEHKIKDVKARGIILDGVKNHIIPHITGKDSTHKMWAALIKLYQSNNQNRKMVLREKLNNIKMNKSQTMASYFTRIQQVRDEISAVGEAVDEKDLVKVAPKGCTKQWTTFVTGILARDKLPNWAKLWNDFTQKEIWEESTVGGQHKGGDEENLAIGHVKKGKGKAKQNQGGGAASQGKKDMSKVKCFACNKFGHYVGQCPNKKKGM
jgi:hypothetical protein